MNLANAIKRIRYKEADKEKNVIALLVLHCRNNPTKTKEEMKNDIGTIDNNSCRCDNCNIVIDSTWRMKNNLI